MKIMLLGLASHAHADGSNAYPALDTLASYGACDRATARRNVRKLEAAGLITLEGCGPVGQHRWRLAMTTPPAPTGTDDTAATDGMAGGMTPAPEVGGTGAIQTVNNRPKAKGNAQARARELADQIPADFPNELRPHARAVMRVLRSVAVQHQAREVTALGVARVCMAYPRHPLVETAHALAAWAADPPRPIRDVVGTYRSFLKRERALACTERLADGLPATAPAPLPGGVVPLRQNASAEERRAARQERRMAQARGEVVVPRTEMERLLLGEGHGGGA
jgi:hypothetical protein